MIKLLSSLIKSKQQSFLKFSSGWNLKITIFKQSFRTSNENQSLNLNGLTQKTNLLLILLILTPFTVSWLKSSFIKRRKQIRSYQSYSSSFLLSVMGYLQLMRLSIYVNKSFWRTSHLVLLLCFHRKWPSVERFYLL